MIPRNGILRSCFVMVASMLLFAAMPFGTVKHACAGPPCEGDFDRDGDVDGSDLAVFAGDFGRTDCPSGPLTLLGTVTVGSLGTADFYGLRFDAYTLDGVHPIVSDVQLKLVSGLLIPRLILAAAQSTLIDPVTVEVAGSPFLELFHAWVKSVDYLPPKHAADPYLVEVIFGHREIRLTWGGQDSDNCTSPQSFKYAHTVGFTGSLPEGLEVTDFGFVAKSLAREPGEASQFSHTGLTFTRSLDSDAPCWFGAFLAKQHLAAFELRKWGALNSMNWESEIYGENYEVSGFTIDSMSSGEIQQWVCLHLHKVRWTHRIFDEKGGVKDEVVTGWDFEAQSPW